MIQPVTWHAVDGAGLALATGRPPRPPGASSPAVALGAAPVATWPLAALADDGSRVDVAGALGSGGARVAAILDRVATKASIPEDLDIAGLARATPGGPVPAPLALVDMAAAAEATERVDGAWLSAVDRCRSASRAQLVAAGRTAEMEAALHLAMLLATAPVDDDCPPEARLASGGRLWLLGGAVAWALLGDTDPSGHGSDPFESWAELVSYGFWPVGPVGERLVVGIDESARGRLTTPAPSTAAGS